MATKHSSKPKVPVDASAGYEKRDVNIKGLFQFALWMAVVLAVTLVGMRFTFDSYKKAMPLGAPSSPIVTPRKIPAGPLLQVRPHQELQDYCRAQQQEVTTYAWINQSSGVVRIPIDRAIELILAKGLPARPAADAAAAGTSTPVTTPTVAGGTDVEGQCGYLTEPTKADQERSEAEAAKAAEAK